MEKIQGSILIFSQIGIGILLLIVMTTSITYFGRINNLAADGSPATQAITESIISSLDSPNFQSEEAKVSIALITLRTMRRHDAARAANLTKTLIQFFGFLAGMTLVFLGSIYVVGKFSDEKPTTVSGDAPGISISIASSSPGLVVTLLGVFLMTVMMITPNSVHVTDNELKIDFPRSSTTQSTVEIDEVPGAQIDAATDAILPKIDIGETPCSEECDHED